MPGVAGIELICRRDVEKQVPQGSLECIESEIKQVE